MWINKNITELNTSDNKSEKYKMEIIYDNKIYIKKVSGLYIKALLFSFINKLFRKK